MKTARDPRHIKRVKIMQDLFAWDFNNATKKFEDQSSKEIIGRIGSIDQFIASAAPQWPLEKINKIDLAVLRQAVYELINNQDTPPKVIIDEAIELGKEYGSESSPAFINGVLGKMMEIKDSGGFTKE